MLGHIPSKFLNYTYTHDSSTIREISMPIHLQFEGGYNLRDLGEITTSRGQVTRKGIFIRSGNLDKLSNEAQEQLIQYGVQTVIDLRNERECQDYPNVFAKSKQIQYRNIPLIGDKLNGNEQFKAQTERHATLHEVYCAYLDTCQAQIGTIIGAIAESPTATVFHCYAGKDRTGIIAALLLALVEVEDSLIATDYAETNQQIMHLVEEWRTYAIKNNRDLAKLERDASAAPETILNSLTHVREHYGSVEEYLRICGVTSNQIVQLKNNFIGE
jgi:protein-tyrosine phosphatase